MCTDEPGSIESTQFNTGTRGDRQSVTVRFGIKNPTLAEY